MAPISHLIRRDLLIRAIEPTRTLLSPPSLVQRQAATVTVVAGDGTVVTNNNPNDSPTDAQTLSPGAIAGIVIGSIAGFLLLVWIFRSCSNLGAPPGSKPNPGGQAWYDGVRDEYPPQHVNGHHHGHHHGRSRSRHSHRSVSRHSHHGHHGRRARSRSEVREVVVPVREAVVPVRTSPRAPPYVYDEERARRGRRDRRSASRGYDGY